MTLHILADLLQGTDEWHDQRRGMVTASAVGQLLTVGVLGALDYDCPACGMSAGASCVSKVNGAPIKTLHPERAAVAESKRSASPPVIEVADNETSQKLTALLAAERITGFTDPTYMNADMWRGVDDEPRAREVYSEHYSEAVECGFMVEDGWGFSIGYSPDGLVGDDGLIEVKSRRSKTQLLHVVGGEVPAMNMPQIQAGLLVSGRKWLDYVSYAGGMHLWVKRVYPDQRWFDAILAAVAKFETNAADLVAAYTEATVGLAMTERPTELEMVMR